MFYNSSFPAWMAGQPPNVVSLPPAHTPTAHPINFLNQGPSCHLANKPSVTSPDMQGVQIPEPVIQGFAQSVPTYLFMNTWLGQIYFSSK